jgi:hypothetical protein
MRWQLVSAVCMCVLCALAAPAAQHRFAGIVEAGGLVDAWRALHPGERGGMTWRGGEGMARAAYAHSRMARVPGPHSHAALPLPCLRSS